VYARALEPGEGLSGTACLFALQMMHMYKWYRTLVVVLLIATNWLLVTYVMDWLVAYGHEAVFTYGT